MGRDIRIESVSAQGEEAFMVHEVTLTFLYSFDVDSKTYAPLCFFAILELIKTTFFSISGNFPIKSTTFCIQVNF